MVFCNKTIDVLCEQFSTFINTLRKEKEEVNDQCPWLDKDDERRNMSYKEILEKYTDLEESCLSELEKKEVIDMLYKCKDTFSLRDEIGTCPNIEVEIGIKNKSPFLLDHVM